MEFVTKTYIPQTFSLQGPDTSPTALTSAAPFTVGNNNFSKMYSSVQINEVKGCVSTVLVPATFHHVYLDNRVKEVESREPDRRLPDGHLHADVAGQQGVAGHLRLQQRAAQ